MHDTSLPWFALLALGGAHGVNPAMGWLFAVGRGLQERDRRAVWRALGPLAAGHALAIAAALLLATTLGQVVSFHGLRWLVALALLAVGVDGLRRHRHVRLAGMRVSPRALAAWSFLVASAHGAGLMVLPFVLGHLAPADAPHAHHAARLAAGIAPGDTALLAAPLLHTLGYLAATAGIAVVVYEKVGLRVLRRAWINLNLLWSVALIAAAVAAALG